MKFTVSVFSTLWKLQIFCAQKIFPICPNVSNKKRRPLQNFKFSFLCFSTWYVNVLTIHLAERYKSPSSSLSFFPWIDLESLGNGEKQSTRRESTAAPPPPKFLHFPIFPTTLDQRYKRQQELWCWGLFQRTRCFKTTLYYVAHKSNFSAEDLGWEQAKNSVSIWPKLSCFGCRTNLSKWTVNF